MKTLRVLALAALLAAMGISLLGCGGGTYLISRSQEIQIGQEAAADFERNNPTDRTSRRARWLADIGQRVAAPAQPPEYPYEFVLVRENVNNAFALPGGPIYLYDGLINTLDADEHKVAWVCGHEISHVREKHAIKRIERAIGAQLLIEWALGGRTARDIGSVVAGLSIQHYSRDNEFEADRHGCRWAAEAGYDPTAAIPVLETFRELQGRDPSDFEILFHSHPGNEDRVNNVKRFLDENNLTGRYHP